MPSVLVFNNEKSDSKKPPNLGFFCDSVNEIAIAIQRWLSLDSADCRHIYRYVVKVVAVYATLSKPIV